MPEALRWTARLLRRAGTLALERAANALRKSVARARRQASSLWAHRPPPVRSIAIAWSAAAAALGAWSVLAQARLPERLPSGLDWAAAQALVERDARPGDAVALSPPWAERAREILPASVPVLAERRYAGQDLVGVRRVWLLSLQAAPGFSYRIDGDLSERASQWRATERLGALEATRYDLASPTLPLAFLPDGLARAEVSLASKPCARDARGAFACAGPPPARIERSVRDVAGSPRPCIVATLGAAAPSPLVLSFPSVRIGRTVHGHAAHLGSGSGRIRVSAQVDGEDAGEAEVGDSPHPFRIDTTRFSGRNGTLTLAVTLPDAGALCLDAVVLP